MLFIITVISIFILSLLVWIVNRFLPFRVCPICAGVSGTWIWLLTGHFSGYQIDLIIPALLMGGSIVGIAYQLEKKLPQGRSLLLWKTFFIPAGFIAAYSLLNKEWLWLIASIAFLLAVSFGFFSVKSKSPSDIETAEKLKQKMEDCC